MSNEDELYDPRENGGGNAAGAPVISWKYARPGEVFTGVVVAPDPINRPGKGYKMGREYYQSDTDPDDKGFLVWAKKNNTEKIKRPVTEAKYIELWGQPEGGFGPRDKVSREEYTFVTEYTDGEFLSDSMKQRLADEDRDTTDVMRRVVRSGADLPSKIDAALKAIGASAATPGQRWTITLTSRDPNVGRQGTTSRYTVKIDEPTAQTKAMVQAYLESVEAITPDEDRQPARQSTQEKAGTLIGNEEPPF